MDIPTPCDTDILLNGVAVFVTHSIPSNVMDAWVKKVAKLSDQPVDWHFIAGRAVVKTTGSVAEVASAIDALMSEHDELKKKTYEEVGAPWRGAKHE